MLDLTGKPFHLSDDDRTWVNQTLAAMDIKAKVGQLFCLLGPSTDEHFMAGLLDEFKPGGILYRPASGKVIRQTHLLLQEKSTIPLLIAANLETGGNGSATDGTLFASQMQVAATGDALNAYRLGQVAGREGRALGVNWTFSPVVDIDLNFRNPITNTRTFGSDPDTVIRMGKACISALHENGIAVSVKHFPGDGVDERDQHLLTTVNTMSVDEWDNSFGRVYREMIESGAHSVMAGHILLPAYQRLQNPGLADADLLPASLSSELLQGLLRGKLGFNGVIVSDATTMTGFTMAMKREDAVPACIQAGCDMFLFNVGLQSDFNYMMQGIERGLLSLERLDEAVTRILAMKASLGLHHRKTQGNLVPGPEALEILQHPEHQEWARACADQAVTLVKDIQELLPLSLEKHRKIRLHILGDQDASGSHTGQGSSGKLFRDLMVARGFDIEIFDMDRFDTTLLQKSPADQVGPYDLIIYYANLGAVSNQTVIRINWIAPFGTITPKFVQEKPTLFISVASPYHLQDVPRIRTMVNAYTASEAVVESLVGKLLGESAFSGQNPVDPFCGFWDARL